MVSLLSDTITCPVGTGLDDLLATPDGDRIKSCIQCGTCVGTCPYGEHMEYPPRRIINALLSGHIEDVYKSDSMLKCVNCYACMEKCPRAIRLSDVLLPLVKEQTLMNLESMPAEFQKALENTLRYGNPMGESSRKRAKWLETTDEPVRVLKENPGPVDVLWFVESYTSYYARGQDNSRALAKLFNRLGVDYAILGNEEKSAGECGHVTWESGLFETLTDYNLALFEKYDFKRIVTGDPHAFNAFRVRYPLYGFTTPVEHTVAFLHNLLDDLKPMLTKKLDYKITFHDPCCLGRRAHIYEEPRELLTAIPGVKLEEMIHNRENGLCCGGGGGGMWMDTYYKEQGMERLSDRRVAEAIATGADVLAVCCPYEISRFEDSLKLAGHDDKMVVRDIVELLVEAMED